MLKSWRWNPVESPVTAPMSAVPSGKAEVAGFAFGDGVHRGSAGGAGGEFERGGVEGHGIWKGAWKASMTRDGQPRQDPDGAAARSARRNSSISRLRGSQ